MSILVESSSYINDALGWKYIHMHNMLKMYQRKALCDIVPQIVGIWRWQQLF